MTQEQHSVREENGGSRPVPDPTILTQVLVDKAILSIREILEARLDGMDKAIELLQRATDRIPQHVADQIAQLQALHEQKFNTTEVRFVAINQQFTERDKRTEQAADLSQKAIDAALQAQKEAAGKAEEATKEQIGKLSEQIRDTNAALGTEIRANMTTLDTKSNSSKERLDRLEGQERGDISANRLNVLQGQSQGIGQSWGILVGAVGLVAVVIGIFVALR